MRKLISLFLLLVLTKSSYSQIIDRYGVNVGMSYATQSWDYKLLPSLNFDRDYKVGLMTFLSAEKDFGKALGVRAEIGYIQKGFSTTQELVFSDLSLIKIDKEKVILHDLAINLGLKISPFKFDYSPYILVGVRGDYMISYKPITVKESGFEFTMYESEIKDFTKFNMGGLFGVGIDINKSIYFEVEYNPNITRNFEDKGLSIKDNCWGIKVGINIDKFIK